MSLSLDLSKGSTEHDSRVMIPSYMQGLNLPPSNTVKTKRAQDISELQTQILSSLSLSANRLGTLST